MPHPKAMRFEARELKSSAEPVATHDLREGDVYFSLQFADEGMLVPILEPLVFLGRNLDNESGLDLLYFQNFESFRKGVRYRPGTRRKAFHVRGPEDLKHIFEYERALDGLLKCSLRRKKAENG